MYSVSIIPKIPDQFFLINLLTEYIYSEILKLIHETHCLPPRRTLLIQVSTATPVESCSRQWGEAYKPFVYNSGLENYFLMLIYGQKHKFCQRILCRNLGEAFSGLFSQTTTSGSDPSRDKVQISRQIPRNPEILNLCCSLPKAEETFSHCPHLTTLFHGADIIQVKLETLWQKIQC